MGVSKKNFPIYFEKVEDEETENNAKDNGGKGQA